MKKKSEENVFISKSYVQTLFLFNVTTMKILIIKYLPYHRMNFPVFLSKDIAASNV